MTRYCREWRQQKDDLKRKDSSEENTTENLLLQNSK
jgi:hypothetical protein